MKFHKLAKAIYSVIIVLLPAAGFYGCGSENSPTTPTVTNHAVYILVPYPDEPLFDSVTVIRASVAGQGISTPISASQPVNTNSDWLVLVMTVPEGTSRMFAVYGLSRQGEELYSAFVISDVVGPGNTYITADLQRTTSQPQQTAYLLIPYPPDELFEMVDTIGVFITGDSIETPLLYSQAVAADRNYSFFALLIPEGTRGFLDIFGTDQSGRWLYRALMAVNFPDTGDAFLTSSLPQIGYCTPGRVKIFRNSIPFGNWAELDSVLIAAGISEGTGDGRFQVYGSAYMGSLALVPGRDLLIFEGWQDLAYYYDYMSAREEIEAFIDSGGVALYMANEGQSHGGYYSQTDMRFPEDVTFVDELDNINLLALPAHDIVANLPDTLTGFSASHGALANLPTGAAVLLTDSGDRPTLIVFAKGRGLVMMSTHPLEYLYHHRNEYTCGSLLSRIVRFLIGMDPTPNP